VSYQAPTTTQYVSSVPQTVVTGNYTQPYSYVQGSVVNQTAPVVVRKSITYNQPAPTTTVVRKSITYNQPAPVTTYTYNQPAPTTTVVRKSITYNQPAPVTTVVRKSITEVPVTQTVITNQQPITFGQNVYYTQVSTPNANIIRDYKVVSSDYAMRNFGQSYVSQPVTYTSTQPVTYTTAQPVTYTTTEPVTYTTSEPVTYTTTTTEPIVKTIEPITYTTPTTYPVTYTTTE
jgi:hypothetical protein